MERVDSVARLACMNPVLHGVGAEDPNAIAATRPVSTSSGCATEASPTATICPFRKLIAAEIDEDLQAVLDRLKSLEAGLSFAPAA